MKWERAIFNIPAETGTDELGNQTVTAYDHRVARARLTNWTLEERTLLGPEYTRVYRKLVTNMDVKDAESVTIDGHDYLISDRITTQRWSILHIRGYKQ